MLFQFSLILFQIRSVPLNRAAELFPLTASQPTPLGRTPVPLHWSWEWGPTFPKQQSCSLSDQVQPVVFWGKGSWPQYSWSAMPGVELLHSKWKLGRGREIWSSQPCLPGIELLQHRGLTDEKFQQCTSPTMKA